MKYLITVIDTKVRTSHSNEEIKAIDDLNDEMIANGHRLFAFGLADSEKAVVIDQRNGANSEIPGTLFNGQEIYSGMWLIDVPTHDMAVDYARKGSRACNRKVELRPLL